MLNPEHVLIPYQLSELPTGPWLIFAPHADDETFGMAGSLAKAKEQGVDTHVIVLTDGALGGGAESGDAEGGGAEDLVDVRNKEVEQATSLLGVTSLQCWAEADRSLGQNPDLVQRILQQLVGVKPGSVFFPAALELHPDHRATAQLVWTALQELLISDEANLPTAYGYEISVQSPVNRLIDITEKLSLKEQAIDIYCSQNEQNNYSELVLALNKTRTFSLPASVSHAEGFYCYSREDLDGTLHEVTRRFIELYK